MNKIQRLLLLIGILCALAIAFRGWRASSLTSEVPEASSAIYNEEVELVTQTPPLVGGYAEERIVGWREPNFVQEYTIESDGDVIVVDKEMNSATGEWTLTAYAGSTPFSPESIANAGRDYFAIVGIDQSTGDTVLERWRLFSKIIRGAPPVRTFVRMQIFRGILNAPPVEIGIDPDKRFVLLLSGSPAVRKLYQIPMQANSSPTLLYDTISQPVLSEAWMMNPLQHASLGRIWLISGMTSVSRGQTMVLVDAANDGVFDPSPIVDSQQALEDSGVLAPSQILDSFMGD